MVLTMDIPQDLMTLPEAVKEYGKEQLGAFGITYWKLRNWVVSGKIRSWKQEEIYFVSRAELEEMIRPKPLRKDDTKGQ